MPDTIRQPCPECGESRSLKDFEGRQLCWKCIRAISPTLPATEKQLACLKGKLIVPREPITRKQASDLIHAAIDSVPYYVADVWYDIKGASINDCGIPWDEAKRLAAMICSRHPAVATSIIDIQAHRYFATMDLAESKGIPARDAHLPVERTPEFYVVEGVIVREWSHYRPSILAYILRLLTWF